MAQQRDTAIRERDAARKATATADKAHITAVSDRDAARRERDSSRAAATTAELSRDAAIEERGAARRERDSAVSERDSAVSERDSALNERDTAQNALALRSLVTSDMVEEYDGINDKLWLHYRSTKVGKVWQQAQEDELLALHQAFSANQISMMGSS